MVFVRTIPSTSTGYKIATPCFYNTLFYAIDIFTRYFMQLIYLYYNEDYVVLIVIDYYFSFDDLVTARLVSAVPQCVLALVIFLYRLVYCRCKIHGLARVFYQVCGINREP